MKPTDKVLLEKVASKDYDAFNVLYERYNRLFLQWTYLRTKDSDMTKDICQLFWEGLWEAPQLFRIAPDDSAKNSFLKILSFRIIDYLRSPAGRSESTTEEIWHDLEKSLSTNPTIETIEVHDLQEIITNTLYEMPLIVQQIVELRWKKQHSTKEVAKMLNLSEKTVNKKYREAKLLLQEKLFLIYNKEQNHFQIKARLLTIIILLQVNLPLSESLKRAVTSLG